MALPQELFNIKFAEYIEDLKILYLYDENFKVVCDKYCDTKNKVEKAKEKIRKDLVNQIACENLSKELEEEILIYLIRRSYY